MLERARERLKVGLRMVKEVQIGIWEEGQGEETDFHIKWRQQQQQQ